MMWILLLEYSFFQQQDLSAPDCLPWWNRAGSRGAVFAGPWFSPGLSVVPVARREA
jgi:hypothetical protein